MNAMMAEVSTALESLGDVQGVQASMILTPTGEYVAGFGIGEISERLAAELGPRISRIFEAFVTAGEDAAACNLRFSGRVIVVRKILDCLHLVLVSPETNLVVLRTAMAIATRKIEGALTRRSLEPEAAAPAVAAQSAPVSQPPPPPTGGADDYKIIYRGTRIR